jgi:DNA-binding transcriptional LysR family regulator
MRPNIVAIANNIETMKTIVQSAHGIAIVPRTSADNEVALGVLKVLSVVPERNAVLNLFRRRQPLPRRRQGYLAAVRDALMG